MAKKPLSSRADLPGYKAGDRFLVKIHKLDRERGVLIPGHRFEPFRDLNLRQWDLKLEDEAGVAIGLRTIGLHFKDVPQFYTMIGLHLLPMLLGLDDPKNTEVLRSAEEASADAFVRVKAFDFAKFYDEADLAAGDFLRFSFLDNEGRRFAVEAIHAAEVPDEQRRPWFVGLAEGFSAAMKRRRHPDDNAELMREAFLSAPAFVRENPVASMAEFLNESGFLAIIPFSGLHFLWKAGTDILELMSRGGEAGAPKSTSVLPQAHKPGEGPDEELTALLEFMGLSFDIGEIEAFIRDEAYRGGTPERAADRCFASLLGLGYPTDQIERLRRLSLEFSARVLDEYDAGAERLVAPVRSGYLAVYEKFVLWLRDLGRAGIQPSQLPREEFETLIGAMREVSSLLTLMNDPELYDKKELAQLKRARPRLAEMVDDILSAMPSGAEKQRRASSRAAGAARASPFVEVSNAEGKPAPRGRKPAAAKKLKKRPPAIRDYLFESRIADIEPPIRRLLWVPGNRSLADLHEILQAAFGWTDSHLHNFQVKKEIYGIPSDEDFEPILDERKVRLDELDLRARGKITYLYDFGDGWEHELVVVKTKAAAGDGEERPSLLDGARARPPEDCGGFPGYVGLLEILSKDKAALDEDERQTLSWCGPFDPESYDSEQILTALDRLK